MRSPIRSKSTTALVLYVIVGVEIRQVQKGTVIQVLGRWTFSAGNKLKWNDNLPNFLTSRPVQRPAMDICSYLRKF